jgi:hypothetical protein
MVVLALDEQLNFRFQITLTISTEENVELTEQNFFADIYLTLFVVRCCADASIHRLEVLEGVFTNKQRRKTAARVPPPESTATSSATAAARAPGMPCHDPNRMGTRLILSGHRKSPKKAGCLVSVLKNSLAA